MDKILAIVGPSETDFELLEEAGAIAATADVEVVVLSLVIDGSDYASVDRMQSWADRDASSGPGETPADVAAHFAASAGADVLDSLQVTYTSVGDSVEDTRPSAKVIDVAENHGCDHVYVANRSRSPAGKALFGEMAQSIILGFDGFVTVRTVNEL
ncbi:universal stress protein [Halomicrococcus sp. NG-SE-24]|uniref:universal stress protein n=1 Tax=Halomicrococcus sp. NG-SE-24 TaxID=3436928 RepID=UPI003D98655E